MKKNFFYKYISDPGLNRSLSGNICWLKSAKQVNFIAECVMRLEACFSVEKKSLEMA